MKVSLVLKVLLAYRVQQDLLEPQVPLVLKEFRESLARQEKSVPLVLKGSQAQRVPLDH